MKSFLAPIHILCGILAFSAWNCQLMTDHTERWSAQLETAAALASEGDWDAAGDALQQSYDDWSGHQTYLHIVEKHDAVDDAEAMYRRAFAFAGEQEPSEFQAEVADLRDQLRLLAEMERFSLKNIL